jgi:folate-binding protein YgfZ
LNDSKKSMTQAFIFADRGLLRLGGPDARSLLQGLITADLNKLTVDRGIYSALLTPQGKYLFDFHVSVEGQSVMPGKDGGLGPEETILLETAADRLPDLERRLLLYRLRASVTIESLASQPTVAIIFGGDAPALAGLPATPGAMTRTGELTFMVDPRLAALGVRIYGAEAVIETWLGAQGIPTVGPAVFARHRIALAVPAGDVDLVVDKSIMLEAGLDQLGAVAFDKGCFIGQELTARTHYRGLVKRRLVPVLLGDAVVEPGLAIMAGEREAGEIRSTAPGIALALVRLDRLDEPLAAGGGIVQPRPAPWQTDLIERLNQRHPNS